MGKHTSQTRHAKRDSWLTALRTKTDLAARANSAERSTSEGCWGLCSVAPTLLPLASKSGDALTRYRHHTTTTAGAVLSAARRVAAFCAKPVRAHA